MDEERTLRIADQTPETVMELFGVSRETANLFIAIERGEISTCSVGQSQSPPDVESEERITGCKLKRNPALLVLLEEVPKPEPYENASENSDDSDYDEQNLT